jgi:hypothetical protein
VHGAVRGRGVAVHSAGWLETILLSLCLSTIFSKICTEVQQVMNRKVVDLTILYNFYKGHIVFFSTNFAEKACQL